MATLTKELFSEIAAISGRRFVVNSVTASAADVFHVVPSDSTYKDECWVYAHNFGTSDVDVTFLWGLTGMPTLPTILFNKEYLVPGRDFISPDHLIIVINNSKKSKYNYDIRSFERIKSLNFNILTAFNQLQIVLNKIESKLNIEENEHESTS